jgi:hypothetical protein
MELYWFFLTDQQTKVEPLLHSHDLTNRRSQYVESTILKGRRIEGIQKFKWEEMKCKKSGLGGKWVIRELSGDQKLEQWSDIGPARVRECRRLRPYSLLVSVHMNH